MGVRGLGAKVADNPLFRLTCQCLRAAAYTGLVVGRLLVAPPAQRRASWPGTSGAGNADNPLT